MAYYNRDNYEKNLESYEVPEEYNNNEERNNFVYGFVVGAVIGTAVGLVTTKSKSKNTKKETTSDFKSSITSQSQNAKQQADTEVNNIKSTVSQSERDAQKVDLHHCYRSQCPCCGALIAPSTTEIRLYFLFNKNNCHGKRSMRY